MFAPSLGFKAGIWFYSVIVISVGIIIFFVLNRDDDEVKTTAVDRPQEEKKNTSMSSVLKDKTIWLIAFNVFFVYAVYCGLTFFIPFLKNIYLLPVALVGAYGIINQYCLKMIGAPLAGLFRIRY